MPYGESPGQAHLVLHSQAAVRAHTEARVMLQWTTLLTGGKAHGQSKSMETLIPLQTRSLGVSEWQQRPVHLRTLLTFANHPKVVAWDGKGHQTQPLLCHGILCLPKHGELHPVLWHMNRFVRRGWCFLEFCFKLLLSRKTFPLHLVFADRRATARTMTFVQPCSIKTC